MDAEELRHKAHAAVLTGLPAGRSLAQIEADVAQCHERRVYMPDTAMLELVVAALDVAGVSRDQPVLTADWQERYLPELTFRNRPREVERLVYALQTAAAFRTGVQPDILEDTYSWGTVQVVPRDSSCGHDDPCRRGGRRSRSRVRPDRRHDPTTSKLSQVPGLADVRVRESKLFTAR